MPGGIHPPLEVMQAWPAPNYSDPPTRPPTVPILACVLGPITIFLLLARLWVRIRIQNGAGMDDWLMVAALPFIIVITIIAPISTEVYGFNKHVWDVEPSMFVIQRKYVLAIEVLFCVASGLIKVSILLFFRRLSARAVSRTFKWASWLSIGFITLTSIAFTLIPIFGCKPISAFWDQLNLKKAKNGYEYHCFDEGTNIFISAVISVVQDLIAAVLPTFLYWNLRISIRQKIALFGIFAFGYGAVAIGALRTYYSWYIFFETYDVTWETWEAWKMVIVELHVGAICANAPALKVFCKQYLRMDRLTTGSKSGSKSLSQGSRKGPSASRRTGIFDSLYRGTTDRKDGYLSEPHTNVSVDALGGLERQRSVRFSKSGASIHESMETFNSSDNIEMGVYSNATNEDSKSASSVMLEGVQTLLPCPSRIHSRSDTPGPSPATEKQTSNFFPPWGRK